MSTWPSSPTMTTSSAASSPPSTPAPIPTYDGVRASFSPRETCGPALPAAAIAARSASFGRQHTGSMRLERTTVSWLRTEERMSRDIGNLGDPRLGWGGRDRDRCRRPVLSLPPLPSRVAARLTSLVTTTSRKGGCPIWSPATATTLGQPASMLVSDQRGAASHRVVGFEVILGVSRRVLSSATWSVSRSG